VPVAIVVVIKSVPEKSIGDMSVKDMNGGSFSLFILSNRLIVNYAHDFISAQTGSTISAWRKMI
jgi:hypothetical protein